jgi:DNA invertase Pin-like site-specific DNA recombinase
MSRDFQRYSIANQAAAIAKYASANGMEVVRTYADSGRSGVTIHRRDALIKLLQDVRDGATDYEILLVYDVSRWGRFQDADEGAYYEFLCKRAGVPVIYVAEPFQNDGNGINAVIKSLKRAMAAEYSRELSVKVRAGLCRQAGRGHFIGSLAGYGLRRMVVEPGGRHVGILERGERKNVFGHHVTLVPGPQEEVDLVLRIFRLFALERLLEPEIARRLNGEGLRTEHGFIWTAHKIASLLRNEKYVGTIVYNRTRKALGGGCFPNSPEEWIRVPGAFEPIVPQALFDEAQSIFSARVTDFARPELLRRLRELLEREGRITHELIKADPGTRCTKSYQKAFGSLYNAYAAIDYRPHVKVSYHVLRQGVVDTLLEGLRSQGREVRRVAKSSFLIDDCWSVSVVLLRPEFRGDYLRWWTWLDPERPTTWTVAARITTDRMAIIDYLLVPFERRPRHMSMSRLTSRWEAFKHADLKPILNFRPPPFDCEAAAEDQQRVAWPMNPGPFALALEPRRPGGLRKVSLQGPGLELPGA